ncbi:MAG TPA: molybdenum cofactor guanylyltransferase [Candidatus Bathyarchaeota archaeon]|nr:molybdenum cofactor guanylyltransferase [Candidatus Bathyarchaeota archaeon]
MRVSAIILAGGSSSRLGEDKSLVLLANKPLVQYVLDAVEKIADEKIVAINSKAKIEVFRKTVDSDVKVVADNPQYKVHSPLVGALTGFEKACGEYSLLLSCDTPFISREVVTLLLELRVKKSAVVPRWPNGYIEPLQAVYHTQRALEAAEKTLEDERFSMRSMVEKLRGVRYVSTLVLQQLDLELRTFFNVNTLLDLKKAEFLLKHGKR